jgi:23S rRNA pseudouridine1911/1915/1917 synthase
MSRPVIDRCEFTVIDETDDWIVVNKAAPLQVHPSRPDGGPTLWHGLRELLRYEIENGGALSIINRLDRDTSGLVMVAKHRTAARMLHKAMMRREVAKEYRAIVWGWPDDDAFIVEQPIIRRGRIADSPIYNLQHIHPDGAPSRTDFRVLRRFQKHTTSGSQFSLLAATPLTGRMHQIRVHLSHAGFPVIGDKLYGPSPQFYLDQILHGWTRDAAQRLLMPRHALHSCLLRVTFENGTTREWNAALPPDMEQFTTADIWA